MSELDFITLDAQLPETGGEVWYYPPGDHTGRPNAQARRVAKVQRPGGSVWHGVFEAGVMGCDGLMQFASDPASFVLVYGGAGYRVNINDPSLWRDFADFDSITHVQHFPSLDALVLLDAGTLSVSAHNANGRMWVTPRLVLDDLGFVGCDDETLTVSGDHTALREGIVHVSLRVRDGKLLEGQRFDLLEKGFHRLDVAGTPDAR